MAGVVLTRCMKTNLHIGTSFESHQARRMVGVMSSKKTKLKNKTIYEISLKTGNDGMWSRKATIPIGGHYDVKSVANQTLLVYWCDVGLNNDKDVLLNAGDFDEFKEIVIKPTAHDPAKFTWEGTVKRDGTAGFFSRLMGKNK